MDHADVVELIELAAVEPDGIERLAAGDTAEAAAVAGHLAGCDACSDLLARTARTSTVSREVIRELPDPALRERTLAFVREVGRDRSGSGAAASASVTAAPTPVAPVAAGAVATPADGAVAAPGIDNDARVVPISRARPRRMAWWAAAVAAVVIAAVGGFAAGGAFQPAPTGDDGGVALAAMQTTMRIASQPDAVRVQLAAATGAQGSGSLVYSASSGQLAMAVTGLAPAPAGATYACWVEQGGQRRRIGVMYMDGGDGAWAGPVTGLSGLAPGTRFGVSLVPLGSATGTPVLLGST